MKKLTTAALVIALGGTIYWWGHSNGRDGNSLPNPIGSAKAQDVPAGESFETPSPTKAREREVY